jgi:electron transport complex protein RnfE
MEKKKTLFQEFSKGIIKENPVLRLVLGTCPTLAVTTSLSSALGMGVAATVVLACSNTVISLLRKVIPQKVRIPAYIVIIASFVTIVQMLVKAFVPVLDEQLGVYLPLIVVNCIILGRAEAFAGKNGVIASAVDGLGMGIGFTAALFVMGTIREILGAGTFMAGISGLIGGSFDGFKIPFLNENPMLVFILAPGGFFVYGLVMALANKKANPQWPVDENTIAIMQFPNNVIGKIFCGTAVKRDYTMRTCLYGTKGTIICDNTSKELTLFRHAVTDNKKNIYPDVKIPVDVNNHNLYAEVKEMCDAIINDLAIECTALEGSKTVAVANACVMSAAKGGEPIVPPYIV